MEINRNQWFMIGLVVLMVGLQLRFVQTLVLNEKATRWLTEHVGKPHEQALVNFSTLAAAGPTPRKIVTPPEWLGWASLSVGSVLILHSLSMRRPA